MDGEYTRRQRAGLLAGPAAAAAVLFLLRPDGIEPAAARVAAVAVLMAVWWITEAIPLAATALLPVVLFPAFGVMETSRAAAPYANHLIFLFLGGFLIAVTMERWDLHRRVAVVTIRLVGAGPGRILLGFMLATAFLSMWISNTATALMMVPIGTAVIRHTESCSPLPGPRHDAAASPGAFGTALMLGIAYSASIGGVATLIGTPPNVILAGFIEERWGRTISFASWMAFGVPLAATMLLLAWLFLRHRFIRDVRELPGGMECIDEEERKLGPVSRAEKRTAAVFLLVAAGWIARGVFEHESLSMITDSTIAVGGAVLLFLIPSGSGSGRFLLDWRTASKIPWEVIILFGGGLSLAGGFRLTGLDLWIGQWISVLQGVHYALLTAGIVLLTIFLTEITSNTATSAMLIPVVAGIAVTMSIHPFGPLVAACVAASYAFMLPVATPPNAVVFSSRRVTIAQMAGAGIALNIAGWLMITIFVTLILPMLWRIDLSSVPGWIAR